MRYFGEPSIETRVEHHGAVVALHGRVTTGARDVKLRQTVRELLDEGVTNIVIDLEDVPAIDSSGMGELVAAHAAISRQGGHLELRHLPPRV